MIYRNLVKEIKKAAKQQKIDNIPAYICYQTTPKGDEEILQSNFLSDSDTKTLKDTQLIKALDAGLLKDDWDTFLVV